MKYETPQLLALTPAISAIQSVTGPGSKTGPEVLDNRGGLKEIESGFMDWED